MADFNAFQAAFKTVSGNVADVVAASKTSSGLPKGNYVVTFLGGEIDTYQDDEGKTWPKIIASFQTKAAPDNPKLVGMQFKEFWKLGPVFEDGSSPDAATIKKMFKKAFNKEIRESGEPFVQDLFQLCTKAVNSNWKLTRKESKDGKYVNSVLGNIATA